MKNDNKQFSRIIITRAFLLVLLLRITGLMYAYDFSAVCSTGQTLYYNITDETNHYVEVTYPGWSSNAWPSFIEKPTGRLVLPEIVTHDGVNYLVTSIADYAFFECQELTSVELSNSISAIGSTQIEFHDVYDPPGSFKNCTSLSSVSFGIALNSIGDGSFSGCSELTTISIPETITRIGREAFTGTGWYDEQQNGLLYLSDCCLGYKGSKPTGSLCLADNTRIIADFAFATCDELTGTLVIPNSIKHIGNGAFSNYLNLGSWSLHPHFTNLQMGNSVITIGEYAFSLVPFQGNLELPNSLISIGSGAFYSNSFTGDLVIPNSVITIGENAFCFCSSFTGNLVIPNSVTTIGGGAFANCSGFTGNLVIPNSVTTIGGNAFRDCTGFDGNLILCNPIESIGASAFSGCYGLVGEITIPASVSYIGKSAFKDCQNISQIVYNANRVHYVDGDGWINDPPFESCNCTLTIGENVESIPSYLFKNSGLTGNIIIPSSVIEIGGAAFHNCEEITSVTIPESVNTIEGWAFRHCSGLTTLVIPNSVTSVGNNAFADCSGLTTVKVFNTTISEGMFSDCTNLSSVVFSGPISSVGRDAFKNCSALVSITIPNSVLQIGSRAFANCSSLQTIAYNAVSCNIEQSWLEGCSAFEELNIGNSVQVVPRYSFSNCVGLNRVVLPESITTIDDFAFKGCSGLTAINIPNTVTSIGNNAFFDCQGLTSVILPASLNTIGAFAFGNCSRLTSVYYQAEQLESGSLPFDGCPSLATIYIDPHVLVIGSEVFRNCQTVHFIVALGDTPAMLEVNAFADIANNSVLMVPCGKQVTYFSSWNMFPYNSIIEDCSTYGINVGTIGGGGSVSSSVAEARMGQEVQLTITPDPGMNLSTLKVCNASDPTQIIPVAFMGKADSFYKFTMPSFEVVVLAAFASNTSVEDNLEKLFPVIVYPNPTKDVIKIKAENIQQITISNMLGQIIYVGRVDGSEVDYNFSGEESGIYLVSVETNRGVTVKKVLVSR